LDHNFVFGALWPDTAISAVVKAVEQKLHEGNLGIPHDQEWEFAEEICKRISRGNGALRLQRDGSYHARLPHRLAPRRAATKS